MAGDRFMSVVIRSIQGVFAAIVLMTAGIAAPVAAAPAADHLSIVVPGAAGGGWDLTGKAMKAALEREGIVRSVTIVRYPGTGGLVGLAQFVARHRGQDDVLMIGGLAMLGAAMADDAAVSLRDVAPIARLTGDWGLIAVRSDSAITDLADLRRAMTTRANALRWAGGALGSPDQALVWSMASKLGLSVDDVLYYGKTGGRRAADALLEGRADVAVSGYAEFQPFVANGSFRTIALAAPQRLAGLDVPTLREQGVDVSIMNWRGVFAPPGLSAAQQDRLGAIVARMRGTATWRAALAHSRWSDAYMDAQALSRFIDRETARWPDMINPPARPADAMSVDEGALSRVQLWALLSVLAGLLVFAVQLAIALHRRRRSMTALEQRCGELSNQLVEVETSKAELVKVGIQDDFGEWSLSHAERDVAWFMLRGLPLKEIADLRGTSERTVRQQAQSIYRKAGLEGRSDLAGRILERFI